MQKPERLFLIFGAISAGLAVALGAMGAHILESVLSPQRLETYITGVEYQMYHSLALLVLGVIGSKRLGRWFRVSGWAFTIGILLFSGSLYVLTLGNMPWMGMVTPIGGIAFIAGWIALVSGIVTGEKS